MAPNIPSNDGEMTALMIKRGIAYVFRPRVSQLAGGSFEARYRGGLVGRRAQPGRRHREPG
jgi:hypothetical protein